MDRLKFVAVIVVVLTIVLGACGVEDSLGITPTTVPPDAARPSDGGSSSPSPLLPAAASAAAANAVAASSVGSAADITPVTGPAGAPETSAQVTDGGNFRLLISDEKNAIGDFASLLVRIDRVGLQQGGESGGWTEFDVPEKDATVDLVLLQGDNAQEVLKASILPGQYSKVFIHVGEVTGFLRTASTTPLTIKLPSDKLQINTPFEVFESSVTTFVYDITVIAAGNQKSGIKYILKPVISESGVGQPFEEVKPNDDRQEDDREELLTLRMEGDPLPGATSTLVVTDSSGSPVPNAEITVNDETVGVTDANGQLIISIPADTDELELEARLDDAQGELEIEF